jgi:hypothetical protein
MSYESDLAKILSYNTGFKQCESVEHCLLLSPDTVYVQEKGSAFLMQRVALSGIYPTIDGSIALYLDGKKYFEVLARQCVDVYEMKVSLIITPGKKYILYAAGDVYFCGFLYRDTAI